MSILKETNYLIYKKKNVFLLLKQFGITAIGTSSVRFKKKPLYYLYCNPIPRTCSGICTSVKNPKIMDFEDEPMDVDTSGNSIRHLDAMDISYNDLNDISLGIKIKEESFETNKEDIKEISPNNKNGRTPSVIKRFSLQRKNHQNLSNITLSLIITIISLITLLIYHIVKFECSEELNLELIKKSLHKNVIGQSQAIEQIIETLQEKSTSKILFLYGGTGVGKTLAISLILENLYHYANIYHYTMPSFSDTFATDLMLGVTFCPTSMIIVDDLNSTDMNVKEQIKKIIEKSENLSKNITIILVFNCDTVNDQYIKKCDYSFRTDLQNSFREIRALKQFIQFNSLSEVHLWKCIQKELGGKNLSDEEFKKLVKNFNVSVDGCKGVYTKIKLLNSD